MSRLGIDNSIFAARTKGWRALVFAVSCSVLGLAAMAWALNPPSFTGYVNDYARMLRPETTLQLEQALRSFAEADSTQVAVLTIDSLDGDSLEDFSIRVVDAWKIGQQGKDNGILFLVVKNDRKMRIEVGRGLEGVLTDLAAGRIVDNVVRPLFKDGRFDEGVMAGAAAIIQVCRGEYSAPARSGRHVGRGQEPPKIFSYLFFCLFIVAFLGRASRPLGMVAGAVLLPVAAFLGLPSIGVLLLLMLLPVGAVAGLIVPLFLGNMLMSGLFRGGGFGGGGGFSGGGFGGFGGGGFGGGGASGGW